MRYLILFLLPLQLSAESDLGTRARYFNSFNQEIPKAINMGMPTYKRRSLQQKLQRLLRKYPQGVRGSRIKSLRQLQRVFSLPQMELRRGQNFYEDPKGNFAAEVNTREGQISFSRNYVRISPISITRARREYTGVRRSHNRTLRKLGIKNDQVFLKRTNFLYLQGESNPALGTPRKTKVEVAQTTTYALRKLDGFLLDGSYIKLHSKGPRLLEGVDVVWPDFNFHPEIKRISLKRKSRIRQEIQRRLLTTEKRGSNLNLRMAVVLRPVLFRSKRYFVPSLKVGVYNKNGEAGNLFYLSMLNQKINYENENRRDPMR